MLRFKIRLVTLSMLIGLLSQSVVGAPGYAVYTTDSSFSDVMDGLKMAIQERGMYINNVMNMGEMLERTGQDLGLGSSPFGQAESIEFCSAMLSREMIQEEPARMVNCPFIISVYTLPGDAETTYVAHREVPADQVASSPVMAKVAEMLRSIAEAGVSW